MTKQQAVAQGILVVCHCGNGFFVPKRRAGTCVDCTFCGSPLSVPSPRSTEQAAAGALAKTQKSLWQQRAQTGSEPEPPPLVGRAAALPSKLRAWTFRLRRRPWIVGGAAVLAIVAVGAAVAYRAAGTPSGWSANEHTSTAGGFAVRLPTGLTARRFAETRVGRLGYTFEGVAFADGTCVGVAYMGLWNEEPQEELPENLIRFLEREYHGEITVAEEYDIRLGRSPGRQVTYEAASDAARKSYSRWFLAGNRLYDVAWIAGRGQTSLDAVEKFLESFRLLAEPDARVTLAK